jgi:nucleotide-sensitive chloride channel 1A
VLQFRILPTSIEFPENDDHVTSEVETNGAVNGSSASPPASASLFRAISNCQDLNPDPRLPGDEDDEDDEMAGGGFDETAPGATGWITSENMAEFMDEEGNFRMPGGVTVIGDEGEFEDAEDGVAQVGGAGSVRRRDEAEEGDGEGESKWQRTS